MGQRRNLQVEAPQPSSGSSGPISWVKGELIGEGTFGSVYKGMIQQTGELIGIKQLGVVSGSSGEMESLRAEINVMWRLDHPNIIRIHEYFVNFGTCYLVMDLLHGPPLVDAINERIKSARDDDGGNINKYDESDVKLIMQRLLELRDAGQSLHGLFALIITPTRELALQVAEVFRGFDDAFATFI